ncbi:translocation/assembly module TamB [Subsaxibacter sp. CAU 1640]|uniref:translocation/assembly module TamB domain-containing protein n=1 Tax=Subsaxibacter sp. CAU 1640 TaxID=2933271 RepID=UPI0020030396|nr:translocation/assembly module TamB [Subsaxibacter sp. CAU 1640]MCK7590901.1 translocation/assembly module TamB [Subsaxibacter sp. CAU 1640]
MLLFIILMLVVSIPAVQTYLGKKATQRINSDFGTNINIERIGLKFNGDVELKSVYIEDYRKDTLININELNTSILSFRNIYNGKLTFGDININGLTFNIKTYKDEPQTNLDVFIQKFEEDNPQEEVKTFLLSSSDISIYDGTLRMINENKENPKMLEFKKLYLNATNFVIHDSDISARINTFAFYDTRGLVIKNMVADFEYTPEHLYFDDLSINTTHSILKGDVRFTYGPGDMQDFTNKVQVKANFKDSEVLLDELNTFYNEFGIDQKATLNVNLSGTLNDLDAENLRLTTNSRTRIFGDINFKNLFNTKENNFELDGRFDNLSSNYYDLRALLPNLLGESIPSVFSKVGNFYITGTTKITPSYIDSNLDIRTDIGHIDTNMLLSEIENIDNASYKGKVVFDQFDIGKLLNDPKVKETSFDLDVDGKGFTIDNLKTDVVGKVYSLNYNGYTYMDVDVSGQIGNNIFNGELISEDENFKFQFDGLADLSKNIKTMDFTANVEYANLNALNFVKKDSISVFKGKVIMSMKGTNINDAYGTLNFRNTTYINQNEEYFFEDFDITSKFNDQVRTIDINSTDIIKGKVSGIFKFEDISKLVENSVGSIYTNYRPHTIKDEQYLDFDFTIYNKIIEVFVHDLELGPNTSIKGRIESNERGFKLAFKSPQIKLNEYFANNVDLKIDNSNPLFNTFVEIDSVNTNFYNVSKFNLINVTQRDTLFIKSEFQGGKFNKDNFDLSLFYTIDKDNKSVVGFKRSGVRFKENDWVINENRDRLNKITFDRQFKQFNIAEIIMSHDDEEIELAGEIRDSTYKDIKLNFKDVDLNKITPRLDSIQFAGNVNGELQVLQQNGTYLPSSNVTIDRLKFNNYELGNLQADIIGNESLTNYEVDLLLQNDNLKSLIAKGYIDVSPQVSRLNVDIDFDEFQLAPLNAFGAGVITNIRGLASGTARVTGSLDKPDINGNLVLNNAGLTIAELNVDYGFDFDSEVLLEEQKFIFQDVVMTDTEYFSRATLNGYMSHNNFSDWRLGLDIDTNRLLVLNTEDSEDALYYGTAFVRGQASIDGPTEQLVISVDGSTAEGTVFKIPLNDTQSFGDNSYIHFLSPEEKAAKLRGEVVTETEVKGLELDFDLDVNQNADIEIVIDRKSGSTIQGSGEGNLLIEINTNGKFNMYGDFVIYRGTYNFAYGGLVQKKLEVERGGNLQWNGDPMKAQVNLRAIYKTNANPSVLLDNPINRSIPVNVELNLSGQLEQPDLDFTFGFPNVSSTIKSELDYRLETKESRDYQGVFLLATGSFASELSLGQQAYGTVEDRVNNLFNSLFSDENDKVQVGVNFESGEVTPEYQTDDRLGLTLSTKISDRVLFNGKVGVPVGGVNQTVIAGDAEIELLLNDDGTLSAKFFNRENNIRNFGEEIGYAQGLGLSYNVEFDTFKELLQIIFSGKNKKEKEQEKIDQEATRKEEERMTPDYITVKPSSEKKDN